MMAGFSRSMTASPSWPLLAYVSLMSGQRFQELADQAAVKRRVVDNQHRGWLRGRRNAGRARFGDALRDGGAHGATLRDRMKFVLFHRSTPHYHKALHRRETSLLRNSSQDFGSRRQSGADLFECVFDSRRESMGEWARGSCRMHARRCVFAAPGGREDEVSPRQARHVIASRQPVAIAVAIEQDVILAHDASGATADDFEAISMVEVDSLLRLQGHSVVRGIKHRRREMHRSPGWADDLVILDVIGAGGIEGFTECQHKHCGLHVDSVTHHGDDDRWSGKRRARLGGRAAVASSAAGHSSPNAGSSPAGAGRRDRDVVGLLDVSRVVHAPERDGVAGIARDENGPL